LFVAAIPGFTSLELAQTLSATFAAVVHHRFHCIEQKGVRRLMLDLADLLALLRICLCSLLEVHFLAFLIATTNLSFSFQA